MGVRVRALMDVFYAGRDIKTGDEFETEEDMHALALQAAGRVEKIEGEAAPERKRRDYRRRDMRADK